jgi:hypothetical protein
MRRLSFALAATLLCACGTKVAYLPLNKAPRAMKARAAGEVEVFTSSQPTRPFTEVGMIEAQQESMYSGDSPQQVFGRLRMEAAQRGCDGLIVSSNDGVEGVNHGSSFYGTNVKTLKGYRGTCIVYNDAEQAPAEAPKTTDAQPL